MEKTVPEKGVLSCVTFCLRSLRRFARCVDHPNQMLVRSTQNRTLQTSNGCQKVFGRLLLYFNLIAAFFFQELSPSGNMHGMPLSFNVIEMSNENEDLKSFDWFTPR